MSPKNYTKNKNNQTVNNKLKIDSKETTSEQLLSKHHA